MAFRDYYATLGVERGIDQGALRKEYRALARKYHPDMSEEPDAETRFREISEAYDVLKDAKKRALYDQYGEDGLRDGFDPRRHAGAEAFAGFDFGDLFGARGGRRGPRGARGEDFGDFFGQQQQRVVRGKDVNGTVEVGFVESLRGCERELTMTDPGGNVRGVKVKVPAGVMDGAKIRLRGQGQPGAGGAGDLLLEVKVAKHPAYWREGAQLHVKLPVTPLEAYRGAKVAVPTLEGDVRVGVPAGSQTGRKLRVRGKGVPAKEGVGDLIVHLEVRLPTARSEELEAALEQVEQAFEGEVRSEMSLD